MTLVLPPLKWISSPNYSSRDGQKVSLIVAHDCEGQYLGSINWFSQSRSQVSAHLVLKEDGSECAQMVSFGNKAWHACNFNPFSEGIEMAGYSARGFDAPEWADAAAIVAYRLHANGLPCRWAEKGIGAGYCSHFDLGKDGGNHRDPTTDAATWEAFCVRVEAAYAQSMPDSWPIAGHPLPPDAPPGFQPSVGPRHDEPYGSLSWAQAMLNAKGVSRPPLIVDGIEGRSTEHAIAAFQQTHGLYIDGVLGPKTIAALAA